MNGLCQSTVLSCGPPPQYPRWIAWVWEGLSILFSKHLFSSYHVPGPVLGPQPKGKQVLIG